jgi:hypothetical protein
LDVIFIESRLLMTGKSSFQETSALSTYGQRCPYVDRREGGRVRGACFRERLMKSKNSFKAKEAAEKERSSFKLRFPSHLFKNCGIGDVSIGLGQIRGSFPIRLRSVSG